jgi:hypothetical protein
MCYIISRIVSRDASTVYRDAPNAFPDAYTVFRDARTASLDSHTVSSVRACNHSQRNKVRIKKKRFIPTIDKNYSLFDINIFPQIYF